MLLAMATLYAPAQTNGSNSPYSRFGLGSLKDQSQGFNKAMSGVALGFRDGNRINMQNPASYSAIDSLSFIFDVGLTLQNVNFKSGGNSINAHNTTLDYINAGFRLCPGLGFSFGFIPFYWLDVCLTIISSILPSSASFCRTLSTTCLRESLPFIMAME